jgi:hypothetical protein
MTRMQPQRQKFPLKTMLGSLLAIVLTAAIAGTGSAAADSEHRTRALHLTKECSQYTGLADSFCTITTSNVDAIAVGARVVYLQAAGAASLDSDIVLVVGPGDYALGHVTLDFTTATGEITISGGTGPLTSFQAEAAVSALGGPNWAWDGKYRLGRNED